MFTYEIIDLGALPGDSYFWPTAINNKGSIVGLSHGPVPNRGAVWKQGVLTALSCPPGYHHATPKAISAAGRIVGWCEKMGSTYQPQACQWVAGTPTLLDPTAPWSYAWGINSANQIVGESNGVGVLWQGGQKTALWTPPGTTNPNGATYQRHSYAINNAGVIVGSRSPGPSSSPLGFGTQLATKSQGLGIAQDLGEPFGYANSMALAVNQGAVAVGVAYTLDLNASVAMLWSSAGAHALSPALGIETARAEGINSQGLVVGEVGASACSWLGNITTNLKDLISPQSGWNLRQAKCVNDSAWISGSGELNGQYRGWLMRPLLRGVTLPPEVFHILLGQVRHDGKGVLITRKGPKPVPPWGPYLSELPSPLAKVLADLIAAQKPLRARQAASSPAIRKQPSKKPGK